MGEKKPASSGRWRRSAILALAAGAAMLAPASAAHAASSPEALTGLDVGIAATSEHVVVEGTPGEDTLTVTATGPDSGSYALNGGSPVPFTGIKSFTFHGGDGNDVCRVVNPAGGLFAPADGIHCNGEGHSGPPGDSLELLGGQSSGGHSRPGETPDAGTISHVNGDLTQVVHYTGLEPVIDTTVEASFTVSGTSGADSITLDDGLVPGDGQLRVQVNLNEPVEFANKTNVRIEGLGGNDTLNVNHNEASTGLASLDLDTGSDSGDAIQQSRSNVPGVAVKLTSGGDVNDANGSSVNITAASLQATAATGVGDFTDTLDTELSNLEAQSSTGGLHFTNTGNLTVGGVTSSLPGLDAVTSGIVQVSNNGHLTLNDSDGSQVVKGGSNSGSIFLFALGGTSDFTVPVNLDAVTAPAGDISLIGGQDLKLGTAGTDFDNDVRADGSVSISAGRDFVVDGFADVMGDDFSPNAGLVQIFGGRTVAVTDAQGSDATVGNRGNVEIGTSGSGVFNLTAPTSNAVFSSNGNVQVTADRAQIASDSGIGATNGVATIQPVSSGWDTDLGSATDAAANTLELSDAEIDRISAGTVRLGKSTSTDDMTITDPITPANTTRLALLTGDQVTQTDPLTEDNLRVGTGGAVTLTDAGNDVDALAGLVSGTGGFSYTDADGVQIASVDGSHGVSASGDPVALTAGGTGSITDGQGTADDVAGSSLRATAGSGVGGSNSLETTLGALEAETDTGGLGFFNTGDLTVGGVSASLRGLRVGSAGHVFLSNNGDVTLAETDGVEQVRAGASAGDDATLMASGGGSDLSSTVNEDAVTASSGDVNLSADQDLTMGATGSDHDNDVRANGDLSLAAGRDLIFDGNADGASDDFGNNTGGDVTASAGRTFAIDDNNGIDATIGAGGTGGGDVLANSGSGESALFRLAATSSTALFSSSGDVIADAENPEIEGDSGITAATGVITVRPVSAGRPIDLGSASDTDSEMELSDAELDRLFAPSGTVRLGRANAGDLVVTAPISPGGTDQVALISGANVSETGSIAESELRTDSGGDTVLDGANDIDFLAGRATGSAGFRFADVDGLDIDTVESVNGIATNDAPITLSTGNGDLDVQDDVTAGAAAVGLTAGGADSVLTNDADVTGNDANLNADRMALEGGTVDVGSAAARTAALTTYSAPWPIDLGSNSDPAGSLNLSDAELDTVTAGTLRIGDHHAGLVTVSDPVAPGETSILSLLSSGGFRSSGAGSLSEDDLRLTDMGGSGRSWSVNKDQVDSGSGPAVPYSGASNLSVTGGDGADAFAVKASPDTRYLIDGSEPSSSPGDTLTYDAEGRSVSGDTSPPEGSIESPGVRPVDFTRIEGVNVQNTPSSDEPTATISRLHASVSPRRARAGRLTRFVFTVRTSTAGSAARPRTQGARVHFAGRSVRTNSRGRAVIRVRLRKLGLRRARITRSGSEGTTVTVRVLRAPRFTG